jgi:uncharacterized membrane protein
MNGREGSAARGLFLASFGLVLLAGVLARAWWLFQPLRLDEVVTLQQFATRPDLADAVRFVSLNNHLLNTLLVRVVVATLGDEPWMLRLPVFLAGCLALPLLYLAVRRYYDEHAALLATGLLAAAPMLVLYSTVARGYALQLLLFLALLWLLPALRTRPTPARIAAFVGLSAACFYTQASTVYLYGVLVVWWGASEWIATPPERRVRRLLGVLGILAVAALVTVLLYAPSFLGAGEEAPRLLRSGGEGRERVAGPQGLEAELFTLQKIWESWVWDQPGFLVILLGACAVLAMLFHRRVARERVPVWLGILVWCVPLYAWQGRHAPVRTWLSLAPIFFALAGAGLCLLLGTAGRLVPALAPRWSAPVLALGAAIAGNSYEIAVDGILEIRESGAYPAVPVAVAYLREHLREGDVVLTGNSRQLYEYYFEKAGLDGSALRGSPGRYDAAENVWVCVEEGRLAGRPRSRDVVFGAGGRLADEAATVEQYLSRFRAPRQLYSEPAVEARLDGVALYRLRRTRDAGSPR